MKKLMFATAAIAAGVAMADITSANVVGYQNITINPGFNMIAFNFQPVEGGEDISIQDFVQNKGDLVAGATVNTSDQIQVWDGTQFDIYYYKAKKTSGAGKFTDGPAWVKSTASTTVTPDTIKRGAGVWFARPTDKAAGVITVSGSVNAAEKTHDILAGFNMISSAFPCDMLLNNGPIDWATCGAVAGATVNTSDQIQLWNGSQFDIYYYKAKKTSGAGKFTDGPAWVKSTASTTVSPDAIPAGKGFWYARPSDKEAGTLVEKSPLTK